MRPGPPVKAATTVPTNSTNATVSLNLTLKNLSLIMLNGTAVTTQHKHLKKISTGENVTDEETEMEEWWDNLTEECRLMKFDSNLTKVRLAAEACMLLGAFAYLLAAVREARFLGGRMFFENLVIRYIRFFSYSLYR